MIGSESGYQGLRISAGDPSGALWHGRCVCAVKGWTGRVSDLQVPPSWDVAWRRGPLTVVTDSRGSPGWVLLSPQLGTVSQHTPTFSPHAQESLLRKLKANSAPALSLGGWLEFWLPWYLTLAFWVKQVRIAYVDRADTCWPWVGVSVSSGCYNKIL